jgi:secreted PhoX family phosphatase
MKKHNAIPYNPLTNASFADVLEAAGSRRVFLQSGMGAAAMTFFGATLSPAADTRGMGQENPLFSFSRVPTSDADSVIVPRGYRVQVFYRWGDPVDGTSPEFNVDAANTWQDQEQQAGMGHDGMQWFPFPGDPPDRSDRGLLVMNHEYADQGLLFPDGCVGPMTREKVLKSQAAHGVSVIAIERDRKGVWKVVSSPLARRISARTPMTVTGPAAGSKWIFTAADPTGHLVLGTFNNCASGRTPWGTYLTCEENFHGVFGTNQPDYEPTPDHSRYGLSASGHVGIGPDGKPLSVYRWWEHDERFDLAKHPNEPYRFGYIVEIDPRRPRSQPKKHTALGRFKHENAAVTLSRDGRVVVYMGDDEKNEYLYKYVSSERYDPRNPSTNQRLLSEGSLYVARFNADQTGSWIELVHNRNGLTAENGFESQAEICVRTRQAADRAGGTMMDRPEWVAVHPQTGDVFVTLTNNDRRGTEPASVNAADGNTVAAAARPPVDAANRRRSNIFGHILKWREADGDAAAVSFSWEVFLLAGDPIKDPAVSIQGDSFGSPDGLWFDPRGILWIQTDASMKAMSEEPYQNLGNNMMLAADPATREVRRFLVGPKGCEVTGVAMTPDCKTMFVNIQHPGEPAGDISDPTNPTAISSWPDHDRAGRPRSATVVITRADGSVIGT